MGIAPPAIDVTADERRTVLALLNRHLPNTTAWACGSRVKWTSRPESDLDLVVFARPEQSALVTELREAFDESDLPFSVDLFVWDDVPESFRERIERDHVVLAASRTENRTNTETIQTGPESARRDNGEWQIFSLHDAGISIMDCEHRTPPPAKEGYPYVAIPQVKNGRIDVDAARRIAFEHFKKWTRKNAPEPHDVVLSRRCNPGETGYVPEKTEFALGQNLVLLRSDQTMVFKPFLRWLARGPQWWEQVRHYLNVGSVFDSLKCADIPNFRLPIPPQVEQRAVAHVLGTLDDKIELNRRMNETLEAMARALFRSWFVAFDPVRARMEGRDPGLPGRIADLFPDRLVDSELGRIPKGWTAGRLSDVAVASRKGIRPADFSDETPYIGLKHMPRRSIALVEWEAATKVTSDKFVFEKGDLLFGRLRPYFHKVGVAPVNGVCSTDIAILAPRNAAWHGYVLETISSDAFVLYANRTSTGTRMPRASWNAMGRYRIALPPSELAAEYEKIARPFFDRILTNVHESRSLSSLRDSLLPELVSGTLRLESEEHAN